MRRCLVLLLMVLGGVLVAQQGTSFRAEVSPEAFVPLGENASWFGLGWGGRLGVEGPAGEWGGPAGGLGYVWLPLRSSDALHFAEGQAGWGLPMALGNGLSVTPTVLAGLGWSEVSTQQFGGAVWSLSAAAALRYRILPGLEATARAAYLWRPGLVGGAEVSLGVSGPLNLAGPRALNLLDFSGLSLGTVFPVFRNYYDDHALGKVTVRNISGQTVRRVRVALTIRQYMDGPKESPVVDELGPGQAAEVNLYALFQNSILDVTETTKATATVSVRYQADGEAGDQEQSSTIRIYDRNAMTWDDDRKAAAFVSGKDPWVLILSNQMTAAAKSLRNPGLDPNLQTAVLFHEGLRLMGVSYVTNPKSPFSQTFSHPEIVDFLKFPRQTLSYRAGDCSDLSILYASFFESVGVETAFITVPGHIFLAFKLGLSPEQAAQSPLLKDGAIVRGDGVWVPLETTLREARFTDAWQEALREWRQFSQEGSAAFYPVHEAWTTYQPMGLPATAESPPPTPDRVAQSFQAELGSLLTQEVEGRLSALDQASGGAKTSPRTHNERGVVLARFGRYAEAQAEFTAAGAPGPYAPSLVNLGNLALLRGDYSTALGYYQKARSLKPDDPKVLMNVVRALVGLGQLGQAKAAVAELRSLDPTAAAAAQQGIQGAETGGRAAATGVLPGDLSWS